MPALSRTETTANGKTLAKAGWPFPAIKTGAFGACVVSLDDAGLFCVISLTGSLTGEDVAEFASFLDAVALLKASSLICTMKELRAFGPLAWGALSSEIPRYRRRSGTIYACDVAPDVCDTMKMMHVDTLFAMAPSVEDARALCNASMSIPNASILENNQSLDIKVVWATPYTLEQKIEKIVGAHPSLSTHQMLATLKSDAYGKCKVGYIGFMLKLRSMNLYSAQARERYSRSV